MKRLFSPVSILVTLLLAVGMLFGGVWSIASAAEGTQPGDTFYPLKTLMENVRVVVFPAVALDDGAVNNVDDTAVNNVDYTAVNNVDDTAVNNVDDGAVNNVDDGAVNNVDDGAVNNVDDGAVNNVDDGNAGDGNH